ncbi:MAG: extracellular solute-binding protein [Protaetiibacter sp.]
MKSKLIAGSLVGVSVFALLAGCSSQTDGGDESTGDPCTSDTPTEITFWHTYSTDSAENDQLTNTVLPEFAKECPGVTVDAVVMPYDGLHDQLIAGVSAGGLPDVMRMDIIWTPEFADLGALQAVDDFDGFSDITSSVLPGPLSTNEYQGAYYGLPLDTNTQAYVYNTDLISTPPTTFDELEALGEELKDSGVSALALGGSGPWNVLPWFWSAGGTVTNDDYTKASGYLDSADSVAALQWLVDFNSAGLLGASSVGGTPDSWGGFSGGQYAGLSDGPWLVATFQSDMSLGEATIPAGPGGSISVVGGENLVMFASSTHQQAAWAFEKFLMSDFAQEAMAEVGQIPVTQSALASSAVTGVSYLAPFVEQLQTAQARTPVPNWTQIDPILTDAFSAALLGDKTAEQALSDAATQIDPLLTDD